MKDVINIEKLVQINKQIQALKAEVFDLHYNRGVRKRLSAALSGGGTTSKQVTEGVKAITELQIGDNIEMATLQTQIMVVRDLFKEKKGKEDKYSKARTLSETIIGTLNLLREKHKQVQPALEVSSEDIFDQAVQHILVASTPIFQTWNHEFTAMQIDLSQDNGQNSLFTWLSTTAGRELFKRFAGRYAGNDRNSLDFLEAVAAYKSNPTDELRASIIDRYIADDSIQAIVCGPTIKQYITSFHAVLMSSKTDVRINQGLIDEIARIFNSNQIQGFDFGDGSRLRRKPNGDFVMSSSSQGAAEETAERILANLSVEELNEVYEKLQTEILQNPLMPYVAAELPRPSAPAAIEDLQGYLGPKRPFDPKTVGGQQTLPVGQSELDSFRGLRSLHISTLDDPVKFIQSFMFDKEGFSLKHNGVDYNITNLGNEEIFVGFQDGFLQNHFIALNEFVTSEPEVIKQLVREIKQNTSHVDRLNADEASDAHSRG